MYGQGTAVDVILAVRLCLPFIWTFSCLSFLSFVCFLFAPPVVLCHNKVSYIPSSNSFLIPSPYGWFRCLCFHSIIRLSSEKAEMGQGLLFSSVWCGFGCVRVWFWHRTHFRKYIRRGVSVRCVTSVTYLCWCKFASYTSSISSAIFVYTDCTTRRRGGVLADSQPAASRLQKNTNVPVSRNTASTLFLSVSVHVW